MLSTQLALRLFPLISACRSKAKIRESERYEVPLVHEAHQTGTSQAKATATTTTTVMAAITKTRPLLQRLAALGVHPQLSATTTRRPATLRARYYSHKPSDGDDGDDERDAVGVNGAENPFERLLQHSQQFRQQMAEQQGWPLAGDKSARDDMVVEQEEDEELEAQDDDTSSSSSSSSSSDSESSSSSSDSDGEKEDAHRFSRRSKRNDRRATRTLHERDQRAVRAMRSVKRRVLHAPDDELDYEHALSNPQRAVAKERKYQQLIHREQDKDRVCRNCGERGHVAKYCLLPVICSNCGDVGHLMRDCIYPDYTMDGSEHKSQQNQERAHEKQRMGKRYIKFKEDFDAEIEEYLAQSASRTVKLRKRSAERLAEKEKQQKKKQNETSQEFKPVIG